MDERDARMALCCVVEPGSIEMAALVAEHGPAEVFAGLTKQGSRSRWRQRARSLDLDLVRRATTLYRLRFVIPGDDEWPAALNDLAAIEAVNEMGGVPFGLLVKGKPPLAEVVDRSVAIVGSRAATPYGQSVATDLAAGLGTHGVSVVSGGAYGIDAAAHAGALAADAPTVAVMAGGLDKPYPSGNGGLLRRVADRGLLIAELPPGQHPTRARFLTRNRLIAALSPVTVLVEAAHRSGARNTVTWAGACNRVVLAVPGPVHSATSTTPHRLIRDAEAVLCTGVEDVLEVIRPVGSRVATRPDQHRPLDDLTADELAVYEAFPARGTMTAGELSLRAGVAIPVCLGILDHLVERGFITESLDGWKLLGGPVTPTGD